MLTQSTEVNSPSPLSWHAEWVETVAKERALLALFETQGSQLRLTENASQPWEQIGLTLATDVGDAMNGIETPDFVADAQVAAIELFIRTLADLLEVSSKAGTA